MGRCHHVNALMSMTVHCPPPQHGRVDAQKIVNILVACVHVTVGSLYDAST